MLTAMMLPALLLQHSTIPAETPAEYDARVKWFRDAKVGIFIHWNPSSIIAREISWCRDSYGREKYDNLYHDFKAEKFDVRQWTRLLRDGGIKYAVLVPKHHDGFCMWDTKTSAYNVMNTPFKTDYLKEMSQACRKDGIKFCLYYSIMDWWNPKYGGKAGFDLTSYKNDVFKPHLKELLTHYGPVGSIWFDGNWESSWTHADGKEIYAYARSISPQTMMGNRIEPKPSQPEPELLNSGEKGVEVNPDLPYVSSFYNAPDAVGDYQAREMMVGNYYDKKAWDSCYNFSPPTEYPNGGWSYMLNAHPRPLNELVNWIVQCAGRDGNALLGIGPRPDGTIDPETSGRLKELGAWLRKNGKAIYGTRGGPFLPGKWGVSTRRDKSVFVFLTSPSKSETILPALDAKVNSARVLGGSPVSFSQTPKGITLTLNPSQSAPMFTIVELALDRAAQKLKLAP